MSRSVSGRSSKNITLHERLLRNVMAKEGVRLNARELALVLRSDSKQIVEDNYYKKLCWQCEGTCLYGRGVCGACGGVGRTNWIEQNCTT